MPQRILRTAAAALAAFSGLAAAPGTAQALDRVPLLPLLGDGLLTRPAAPLAGSPHRLTIEVRGTGRAVDGAYRLECGPTGGTHPQAARACERLAELSTLGGDPFAPVPAGAVCTFQHGGNATARVTGRWYGRPVDARFSRTDGCEIARWNDLVPVLPSAGGA
ncbi:SSI family serine proteinase inhibitor [Streptomyces sp. NPDC002454]|uniref:SSI family serine proteinase inhibitor n=1 Tax=Streptomyces sp. NPDC002490 TaxID=3154416 RepID=UPI00333243AD